MNTIAIQDSRRKRAFTLVEFIIASSLVTLMVLTFSVFIQATGITIASVTNQSTFNQSAGHASQVIIRKLRIANTATNSSDGNSLTLSFDDNPEVDSNGDDITWNDLDHFEQFALVSTDNNLNTLTDNMLTHNEKVGTATAVPLIPTGVRRLTGLSVFAITNEATVMVNFGVLATNQSVNSQGVEIRTATRLRNSIE